MREENSLAAAKDKNPANPCAAVQVTNATEK
jgi:hypothetical protein